MAARGGTASGRSSSDRAFRESNLPSSDRTTSALRARIVGFAAGITLLLLTAAACGSLSGAGAGAWDAGSAEGDDFALVVENQSFNEARIYSRWNGDRRRLGSVGGNQTRTFSLPWRASSLRVEVDFLAAGGFISDPVTVSPGDTVHFRIPPHAR